MAENRDRLPSMNIHKSQTTLSRADPLKKLFRGVFEALPPGARGHAVAFIGEFIGTMFFIFMAFAGGETASAASNKKQDEGVSTATPSHTPEQLLYIALAAGLSLLITAWTFFRISGGLFNPSVSLGMALIGAITWARCLIISLAQTLGTIAAAYMVSALFNGGLHTATGLGGAESNAQGAVIEMLLTCQLCFTIFMLAAEQHDATFLAPIGIGLSLVLCEMVGVFWTGGSLNPVRSLAPCIVNHSFSPNHWIYWVGPTAGAILAALIYKLVKALEYESANGEDPKYEPIPQGKRAPSVVPMTGVASHGADQNQNNRTEEVKAAPPPAAKKPVAILPECTAD